MSNSPLVTYTRISPNRTSPRNSEIDTVSIHCVVGQLTAKQILNMDHFDVDDAETQNDASCNYAIGCDGSIGLCCEEKDRSWCTSSRTNDHRAITIEVASDTSHPYRVNEKAYAALIDLLVDICQRNPKLNRLRWLGDKTLIGDINKQNMTVHRWFANKACPGDYLYNLHSKIAAEVNARLDALEGVTPAVKPGNSELHRVQTGAFSKKENALALKTKLETAGFDTYLIKVDNLFKVQVGAFGNLDNAETQEAKLKAAGFDTYITTKSGTPISDDIEDVLVEGDRVRMSKDAHVWNKSYKFQSWVYDSILYVREIDGNCITVSTQKTGAITGCVHKQYLTEI